MNRLVVIKENIIRGLISVGALVLLLNYPVVVFSNSDAPVSIEEMSASSETPANTYTIGVLAFRGEENALKRWAPTTEYLNQKIPNTNFIILPMGLEELRKTVSLHDIDFVLTNTGQYVELEVFYGVSRIATVKNNINGQPSTSFGAVIFTRADRDDIQVIEDLKGKRFMGVKRTGFGGFQMAWRELIDHGVNPFKDFESLEFSGFPQDEVAYAVRDGLVDAGTFRSETLENMSREGKIKLSDYKILHPKQHLTYSMLHSTRLYPVWPFARLKHTPIEISEKVASALLSMPANSEAAIEGRIMGWTIPVDYQPVHELMRELRVGPYAGLDEMSWKELITRYWVWLAIITVALLLLSVVTLVLRHTNRELKDTQQQLEKHQQELVNTVHARTADLVVMRDQALSASEAKSNFLSKISHELRTPLNAIIGYTDIVLDDLKEGSQPIEMKDVNNVRVSALHLLSIINDLLDITRLEKGAAQLNFSTVSISRMLGDVMSRAQPLAAKNGDRIEVRNHLGHDLIETDKERLQDALDHVLGNACKYTANGVITIDVEQQANEEGALLVFRVIDNGIGISLEQKEQIFNVFVQGDDSSTRRFDGLGLGLAKSRGYCRLLGGDITLNSEPGKGSEFIVSIPVKVLDQSKYQAFA